MKMENDMAGQIVIFRIEKEEFGIYVKNVREIVRLPKITKVPGSPPYILGICNLRGNVIPVIDSKTRFNESLKTEMTEHTRMLVTDMEGFTNGLVIDSVTEVTLIEKNSIEPPPEMTKNVERKFLEGVIKLKDGKRLVLILNIKELLKHARLKQKEPKKLNKAADTTKRTEEKRMEEEHLVTFISGEEEYAFDINKVREILRVSRIVKIPDAPNYVRGILSVRDNILPIIDFRSYMGRESLEEYYSSLIEMMKEDHIAWVNDLKTSLEKNVPFVKALDPHKCKFGKWLDTYNSGSEVLSNLMQKLKVLHKTLHENAAKAIKILRNDETKALSFYSKEIEPVLKEILDLLNTFKDEVHKNISEDQKILVIQTNGINTGILVDHVEEVVNIDKKLIDKTDLLVREEKSDLKGVAKLNNGERLIMIIDENAFLEDEGKEFMSKIQNNHEEIKMEEEISDIEQLVTFSIEKEEFGIKIMQVREINRVTKITKLPRAPKFIEGVINLRGEVIPVIDLRKRFDIEKRSVDDRTRVIIVDVSGKKTGLIVDRVNEVLRLPKNRIEDAPEIIASDIDSQFIEAVGKLKDNEKVVMILNVDKVLSKTEKEEFSKMTAEVNTTKKSSTKTYEKFKSNNKSFKKDLKIEE